MRPMTYVAFTLLTTIAACTASGGEEPAPEPGPSDDAAVAPVPEAGISSDAAADVDPDAELPLVCSDAGLCETRLPRSDTGTPLSLRSVWVAGENDVWSVSLEGFVVHYDGTSWSTAYRTNHELYSVWATPTSVWVGGEAGIVLHRSAAGDWSRVEAGHVAPVRAIYGTGDDDVWFTRQDSSVDHFDGTTLTIHPSGIAGLEISSVFGRPGFGTYGAGRVRPAMPATGVVADQPYVLLLSTANLTVFNTSLTTRKDFSPISGFVADSEIDGPRIFLAGYTQIRSIRQDVVVDSYQVKYCAVGAGNAVTIKTFSPLSIQPPLELYPEWVLPAWTRNWSDIQLLPNTATALRWNGTTFEPMPLSMGYERPSATVFAAHNTQADAWAVGNGFALKGAMP